MHERDEIEIPSGVTGARQSGAIHPRLGIIGGGQLAKMTALAGLSLGCDVVVLERNSYSPAATLATHSIVGDWDNPEALFELAHRVDVVTLENEFVDARGLGVLEAAGFPVFPGAACLARVQDKFEQKRVLAAAGLAVPAFLPAADPEAVRQAGLQFGWPLLLKARRDAYDGKGNVTVTSPAGVDEAWSRLGGDRGRALYVEAFCPFQTELAVMVTRGRTGESVVYPVVETLQENHVCHLVKVPAEVPAATAAEATRLAEAAVSVVGGVGTFGVEMFLTAGGTVLINELAPRVHNSGHYTIEACDCSQFENHVRAVLGWPLGRPRLRAPAAVMVNLLGRGKAPARPVGLAEALAVPGAHVHLYGKAMSTAGRKLGHVTALGETLAAAQATATRAARALRFGESP